MSTAAPPPDHLETLEFTAIGQEAQDQQQQQEAQPAALSNAEIISGAIQVGRDVFCTFTDLSSPKDTLNDSRAASLGEAWGKVCDKRGYNLQGYLGDYMLEIAAAMATFAIAREVRAGVMAELKAREPVEAETQEVEATEPEPFSHEAEQ